MYPLACSSAAHFVVQVPGSLQAHMSCNCIIPGFILNLENLENRPFLQKVRENLE